VLFGTLFRGEPQTEHLSIPLEGAMRANVRVRHGAGRLNIRAMSTPGTLLEGDFGGGVEYKNRREGDVQDVKLRVPEHNFPFIWPTSHGMEWDFALARDIPLALDFKIGASENLFDLRDLRLTELSVKCGASSTSITLPANAGHTRVSIESGAASVNIAVPDGVAASIRTTGGLSSISVDTNRFHQAGNVYRSPDYDTAANRAEISVDMGVGSVKIS
jgi:hypothetical protein